MSSHTSSRGASLPRARWLRTVAAVALVLLIFWGAPALAPEESGWHLGWPFRLFYSGMAIAGGLFYLLLDAPPARFPASRGMAMLRIASVYALTVGGLTLLPLAFPRFGTPTTEEVLAQASPEARGRTLFNDSRVGCVLCHAIEGVGGTRGPDLSGIGGRAPQRVPGLPAGEYLRQSIVDPGAYLVEGYPAIMPAGFDRLLTPEQLADLVAYLESLR